MEEERKRVRENLKHYDLNPKEVTLRRTDVRGIEREWLYCEEMAAMLRSQGHIIDGWKYWTNKSTCEFH